MDTRSEYVWGDQDAEKEFTRLTSVSQHFDPQTRSRLAGILSDSGLRCLEVGPGTGSIAKWLVEQGCFVVAIDITDRYFPGIEGSGVELRVGDIRDAEFENDFDLIYMRLVLHHLPERREVVKRLAGMLRPEGWLVAEEPCTELIRTVAGSDPLSFLREVADSFLKQGIDYKCGAYLPSIFADAGLEQIDAVGSFLLSFPGSPGNENLHQSMELLKERLVPLGTWNASDF